mgnify:CR=1 FL=1
MTEPSVKKSIFSKIRNNFIAGIVVLIPIGITLYLTLFLIRVSGGIIPKEINPNNYLPFNIPGVEIVIALIIILIVNITYEGFQANPIFSQSPPLPFVGQSRVRSLLTFHFCCFCLFFAHNMVCPCIATIITTQQRASIMKTRRRLCL